ncbi:MULTISPECIES: acyl-CoA dehydrogenase family protein [Frankia]|uniref:Acyl-CoA dehydrogenase n=1 Tax=Frankia alni (strain DSM 45986 / CECT 9034 / ACN14a) TaxID=326424 RepID=Q0RG79_FRAAA|nr:MULTISPECIES: acyl-CoA dehydrogenase family protein [Frankia]CAJ63510.1 putative acyl-CoA dehydrogenase [Frankia alni ACN14a]
MGVDWGSGTELGEFRTQVRAFIAGHAPGRQAKAGVRSPETAEELAELRRWTAALFEAGYLGADWPVEFGGEAEHDPRRDVVVSEEIARARAPMHSGANGLAASALIRYGTDEQKAKLLPAIRSNEDLWCQLFSEPDAGSDLGGMRTRAVADGDSYVVTGQKVWTTNGHWANRGYLLARTNPDVPKHKGITAFAIDMDTPGIDVRPLRELTGTSDFNEVFFDGARIPASAVIGTPGQGWIVANASLAEERNGVSAAVVDLQLAWEDLHALAQKIEIEGRPALELADIRQRLGALRAEIRACALLGQSSFARWRVGRERVIDAPAGKLWFSELNLRLHEFAVDLLGARGILTEGDVEAVEGGRWQDAYLYARAYTIAGGSSEIMRNLIAERALGLPR